MEGGRHGRGGATATLPIRVIPRLDIKGPNLVKGIHLEGLRVLGKPWDFAQQYDQDGADELIYIDMVASLYGRNNLLDIVTQTANTIFIPLTVGGGIRTLRDIQQLLRAGADKVAVNTAAIQNPSFIREAAQAFGSQCIVLSIQAKRMGRAYIAFTDNARENSGKNVYDWIRQAVGLGVGEIMLTSIDQEGTGQGFDIELTQRIADSIPVPLIAHGGCGRCKHFIDVIQKENANAVCGASIFHYYYLEHEIDRQRYSGEGNIEFIKRARGELRFMRNRMHPVTIQEAQKALGEAGIACRN